MAKTSHPQPAPPDPPGSSENPIHPAGDSLAAFAQSIEDYAFYVLDTAGCVLTWSLGAEKINGFSAGEILGKNHAIFYPQEEIGAGTPEKALQIAQEQGRHLAEGWRIRKDGTRYWAEVLTSAIRGPDGTLRAFAKVVRDVTHRMSLQNTLEKAAETSKAQVHAILDLAVDAIITIDKHGTIGIFNRAAQRMFGYTPAEVVGKNVNVLMPQPYKHEHDHYMSNYLHTGKKKIIGIGREVVAQKKDGTIFPIDLAVSEVKIDGEQTFTGIVRDITERKRLEKEILEISEREQRRIGQDLHDGLCQQLTGIAFLMQALQQKLATVDSGDAAQAAQISSLLKEAVTQARNLSHGLYPVDPQPDGLMLALRELAASIRSFFNIECIFRCPESVMMADNSVATHLYRIGQESVQNAIRHGKASRVTIELANLGQGVQLTVTDNGVGFPEPGQLKSGMGLRTMSHRAKVIGASFSISGLPKGGTRMTCSISRNVPKEAQT